MGQDYSWRHSAEIYDIAYRHARKKRGL
jgi:hypothetical protein